MRKIIYISLFIGTSLLSSCSDWLDVLPKNEQITANYWKTKEDVESILTSGYNYMRQTTPYLIDWGEIRGASIYYTSTGGDKSKLQDFKLTAETSISNWALFYKVINMANSVIKYAPEVQGIDETYSVNLMKSNLCEAYFMRAWTYFVLVRNFKEVPLALEPYVDDSAPYSIAKSTEKEVIAQIKSDVTTALATGAAKEFYDNDRWNASKGRVTKWALLALMSDVSLWAEDYDNCIKYADELINATVSLRPAFMQIPEQWISIFNPGNSNESIFELNWDGATYNQESYSPSNYFINSETAPYMYSVAMVERFLAEDEEIILSGKESIRGKLGSYLIKGDPAENKACIWKYVSTELKDEGAVRPRKDANFILYRMADIMLMKAEALIWKGGEENWTSALDIINKIRKRSNLSTISLSMEETTELSMLTVLLNERDMELSAEGKRWYDLVRFGKSQSYKYKSDFINIIIDNNTTANEKWIRSVLKNDNAWYLPIQQSEIEANEILEQNPYYDVTK